MKKTFFKILSVLTLIICLVLAWLNFTGKMPAPSFKMWFLVVSVAYFCLATFSVSKKLLP
jgi:hypothetical protein